MPVLDAFYRQFSPHMPMHVIGQTQEGNVALAQAYQPPFSLLDDSALQVSFAADIETVPTLLVLDSAGEIASTLVGFVEEWQQLAATLPKSLRQQG